MISGRSDELNLGLELSVKRDLNATILHSACLSFSFLQ
jgi:hypothetical protein